MKRVRGAHKAFLEFVETLRAGERRPAVLRVGIADADAPDRLRRRSASSSAAPAREARIEVETTLGAVVGTHAGPGTVGFFWFDEA